MRGPEKDDCSRRRGSPVRELFRTAYEYVKEQYPLLQKRPLRPQHQPGSCHGRGAVYQCFRRTAFGTRHGPGYGGAPAIYGESMDLILRIWCLITEGRQ